MSFRPSEADPPSRSPLVSRLSALLPLAAAGALAAAAAYVWLAPLSRPRGWRGDFLGGTLHLEDVYLGSALAVAAVVAAVVWLTARGRCPTALGRATAVLIGVFLPLVAFDLAWVFGHLGAWKADPWLDLPYVSRRENVSDPALGFRHRPHLDRRDLTADEEAIVRYRTDERGFRNPPGVERAELVFLGDSFTEAVQVDDDETFVRRVGAATGRSVVNLGVGAYGPPQELLVLKRHALSYRPRVVVWQLFEGNDLRDAETLDAWRRGEDPRPPRSVLGRLVDNSFYRPLFLPTRERKNPILADLLLADGSSRRTWVRYRCRPDLVRRHGRGLEITVRALAEGAARCRARGVRLAVVLVPVMACVNGPRLRFDSKEDRARVLPAAAPTIPRWNEVLARICAELGVACIDLLPDLRAAAEVDPDGLYVPDDGHLGPRGHAVAARRITTWWRTATGLSDS